MSVPIKPPNGADIKSEFFDRRTANEIMSGEGPAPQPLKEDRGEPVFELVIPSTLAGVDVPLYHFKIWGDGHVEGFDKLAKGSKVLIKNGFPLMIETVVEPMKSYIEAVYADLERIAPSGAPAAKAGEFGA